MLLQKLTPNLMVEDVAATIAFYHDLLGFEALATVPEEPPYNWAMLAADEIALMVQTRASLSEEIPALEGRPLGGALTLYIEADDIPALYERVQGKARLVAELHTTFYGTREFAIEDCNGYVLAFAGHLGTTDTGENA